MAANPDSLRISVMPPSPAVVAAPVPVTFAAGDGIGPEITEAVLRILVAAGAPLRLEEIRVGRAVYEAGVTSGIPADAWESLPSMRTPRMDHAAILLPDGGALVAGGGHLGLGTGHAQFVVHPHDFAG